MAPTLPPIEAVLRLAGGWSAIFDGDDMAEQRDALGALVERVTPSIEGWRRYSVDIAWTPLAAALRHVLGPARQDGTVQTTVA